jgi:N-acetyl-gamma-glutamyl-phosphate reductase
MSQRQERKIRVILVGGSGYSGLEAIRLIQRHPHAEMVAVFGPELELGPVERFHPAISKCFQLSQELFRLERVAELNADLAMLCVPHKVATAYVPVLRKAGLRVIDWSADYRLRDVAVYEKWYERHGDPAGLAEAVYGLPEYFAEAIRAANLVANPGCYPTCSALALAPLLKAGLIQPDDIVVNAISGISGAGRTPRLSLHFPERADNFEPYAVSSHRHMPEIEQTLSVILGKPVNVLFQPHLCPMDRGMLATIYAKPVGKVTESQLHDALASAYEKAPFVRVRKDILPATKYVIHTNFCDVAVRLAKGRVIVFGALDNLVKGASGQAVQNMNIMFGFEETTGLY